MVSYGMVWSDVWRGVAWRGVVWCGMVCPEQLAAAPGQLVVPA